MADLLALSARFIDEGIYEGPGAVNRVTTELSEVAGGIGFVEAFSHVIAFSTDAGASFGAPVDIDAPAGSRTPLGRVGLLSDGNDGAILTWLVADGARAFLMARRLPATTRPALQLGETVALPTSGLPRAATVGPNLIVVWRVPPATLQTARIPLTAL